MKHNMPNCSELAETAAGCQQWNEAKAAPWRQVVPRLEEQMVQALRALEEVTSVRDAATSDRHRVLRNQ